ncbi:MAG: hypothetical protein QMD10_11845, partial [Desulfitobacteriaceae bacterium]|nr:hypothetical protein [Desulfitobacteriaceae bacterium]
GKPNHWKLFLGSIIFVFALTLVIGFVGGMLSGLVNNLVLLCYFALLTLPGLIAAWRLYK